MEITNSPQITPKQSKISIIVTVVLIVLLVGSVYISQLIFQEISQSFNINILEARLVFSLSCFCYAISFFIYGPLSDQISTRLLVIFGCIGTIFCLGISGFIQSFRLYLFIMSLTGFFAASVPAALFAYTAKTTPNKQLPQKMGLMISASIVGMIFSRSFIAILTDNSSWQFAFIIYAILIFCTCLFIPYSIKNAANNHKLSIIQAYLNATQLLLHKTIIVFLMTGFILFFIYLGISSFLTFYLKGAPYYLSSTTLGWLNFAGISAVIGATITGKLSQSINGNKLLIICLLCISASIIIIGLSSNLIYITIGIFSLFLFVFSAQPIIISIINQTVTVMSRGTISSLYLLACLAGGSIGTYLLGIVYEKLNWNGIINTCIILSLANIALAYLGTKLLQITKK
ncbi:Sugar transporter superfamily protein YybF [Snodgrassella communis]|uniref:MFS transporter n=1 Tax=Snodgrassella communis TaxID=2946699 RepID=UPI0004613088|nr:MFS transporter [Snodgrassella communis]KDN13290.1 Sugar transporter superfamily protein YybF [Snodgrassella communis]